MSSRIEMRYMPETIVSCISFKCGNIFEKCDSTIQYDFEHISSIMFHICIKYIESSIEWQYFKASGIVSLFESHVFFQPIHFEYRQIGSY